MEKTILTVLQQKGEGMENYVVRKGYRKTSEKNQMIYFIVQRQKQANWSFFKTHPTET